MRTPRLLHPGDVRQRLSKRYQKQQSFWLAGQGTWPLDIPLGKPRESDAQRHPDVVEAWVLAWQRWQGPGNLEYQDCQWRSFGPQRLPIRLSLAHAGDVMRWLDETERWERATGRFQHLVDLWPSLAEALPSHFAVLADYGEADFERLVSVLVWLSKHPCSDLYPRQLPIPGLDSKWMEGRKPLLQSLMAALRSDEAVTTNFYDACGLRTPPPLVRFRILDSNLRRYVGGLSDVTASPAEISQFDWQVRCAYIVENIQTGLSFHDLPGSIVFMGMGYSVELLGQIPWLQSLRCIYWGDIDTHGFAILNRARSHLPQLESCLMTESTLLQNRELWTEEERPHAALRLPYLTVDESNVYQGLKEHCWGIRIRLEQERINWQSAWGSLCGRYERRS